MNDIAEMHLNIPANAEEIPEAAELVARFAASAGLDKQACFQIQVVVAEALNNIVDHGLDGEGSDSVHIHCGVVEDDLEINIRDEGRPYDQLPSQRFPDGRAEGGRGWPIIVSWADSIEYRSARGRNELTLRKTLA
jgi:serine/threonine-protein kinase RsbW